MIYRDNIVGVDNMKDKKRQIILVSLLMISLLLVTLGVSFSLFSYVRKGSTENSVKLGSITFKYTENSNIGNGIMITEALPVTDEVGKIQSGEGKIFDFKVESNLSRSDLEYEIVAQPTENNTIPLDAVKFYLTNVTDGTEEELLSTIGENGKVKTLDEYSDTTIKNATGKTIYQETILRNTKGYLKNFRARMWLREDLDWTDEKYMGKSGAIRINVYANSDHSMASTDTTSPDDIRIERVTANKKYLFTSVTNEEYQYELTVPNEVDNLDVSVIPSSTEATVEITSLSKNRSYGLMVGDNFFNAKVISANKEKSQNYILKVTRVKSSNTGLSSLTVDSYSLTPAYSDNVNNYQVTVPYEIETVTVNATKQEETETIKGLGNKNLVIGTNEVELEIKAEDGTIRKIVITIERQKSGNAGIENVEVNGYTLSLVDGIYQAVVPYNVTKVTLANVTTTGATVTGIGEKELKVGNNDYSVEVTSASGKVKTKYVIRVVREKDTDNTLKSLSLTSCSLDKVFASDTLEYSCTVENNITETTISATANSSVASITGLGKKTLVVGDNRLEIIVTAQNGVAKTYQVVVHRKSNDANLNSLSVTGYTISPVFNSSTTSYTVSIPYTVTEVEVVATANNQLANATLTNTNNLTVGENLVKVTVTAEDGTIKVYQIIVTRRQDTNNNLNSLSLSSCTLSPTFSSSTTSYTCTVENSVTSTTVTASTESSVASIEGTGVTNLSVGTNTIKVNVTAQNGSVKTYTVVVTRKPNSDATLKSLGVTNKTITPTFDKDTLLYTLTVPYSVDNITITGVATQGVSSVTGLGSKVLVVGENSFDIKVTAEDKTTTKTYNITVTRQKDTDTSLKSIGVTGYDIVKVDNNNYTLTVENNVTNVEVTATAASSVAIVTGTGKKTLNVGENVIKVIVTSQSGAVSTYNVKVTRKASSDATLKSLTVSSGALSPTFSASTTSYTVSVPYSVTSLTVGATVNNSEASVTGTGSKNLSVGDNKINVVVTAGDKTTKTYIVTVTRQEDTVNTLKSLSLTDCTLSPTFSSSTTSYTCTVANSVTTTTVAAATTSSVATLTGTGSKTLNVGDNTLNIVVTSQSGSTKTYSVKVHRKSNDANLSSLSVTGYTISPTFSNNTTAYTLTVPNATSSITVNASKSNTYASISGTGSKILNVGSNTIKVTVTAEDGNTKTYTITVKRKGVDTITLSAKNTTYTGSTIVANTATATSGTSITYTYYSTTDCSGTALSGAPTNVGNYSVKAVSTGNGDYEAGSKCVTHTIIKGTPTISLTAKTVEATGSAIAANAATAKNPNGSAVTLTYSYTYYSNNTCTTALSSAPSTAGTYYVKATSTATTNLNSASSSCVTHTINKNTNNNLSSLSISGYSISPSFAAGTTSYTATTEASSVTVNAKTATSLATVTGTGSKTLSWGSNALNIIVTSQSGAVKTYKITVNNQRPTAPSLTGGSDNWVSTAPTIKVSSAGTAISGVKEYEYYKSTSSTAPTDSTTATGTTSGNVTISDEGTTYIWYRTVSNNGFKSAWSSFQVTNLDTIAPTIKVSVSGKVATFTFSDNVRITGYGVNQSNTEEPSYTETSNTSITWTASNAGTYYVWVKDTVGNKSNASFTIDASAFGYNITYYVDGTQYTELIQNGASALRPTTFTPSKNGYTFVGWRDDKTASSSVLSSKIVQGSSFNLYAVFKKIVYLYTQSNGTTQSNAGTVYYNSGNIINPTIYVSNPARSGYVFRGWSSSNSSTTITNSTLSGGLTISDNTYRYAVWTSNYIASGTTLSCSNGTVSPSTWKQYGYTTQTVNFVPDWSKFSSYTINISGSLDDPYKQPYIEVALIFEPNWQKHNFFSGSESRAYWAGFSASITVYPTYATGTKTYKNNPAQTSPTVTESFTYNSTSQITRIIVGGWISDNSKTGTLSSTITGNGGSTFVY